MTLKLKKVTKRKELKDYTYLGCSLTRNRSAWCFRLCTPDMEGNGHCGRIAPHSIRSRIQISIDEYKKNVQV